MSPQSRNASLSLRNASYDESLGLLTEPAALEAVTLYPRSRTWSNPRRNCDIVLPTSRAPSISLPRLMRRECIPRAPVSLSPSELSRAHRSHASSLTTHASLPENKDDVALEAALTREFCNYGTVFVKIRRDNHNMPFAFCQYTVSPSLETIPTPGLVRPSQLTQRYRMIRMRS